jgi:hypothetical protein
MLSVKQKNYEKNIPDIVRVVLEQMKNELIHKLQDKMHNTAVKN